MNKTGIILFAVSSAIALPFAAQAQQSFVRELADMASAAADAAREQKEQAAAPEAVTSTTARGLDARENPVLFFENDWSIRLAGEKNKGLTLDEIAPRGED